VFEGGDSLNLHKVLSLDLVSFRRRRSVHLFLNNKHLGAKRLATAVLIGSYAVLVFLLQYKFIIFIPLKIPFVHNCYRKINVQYFLQISSCALVFNDQLHTPGKIPGIF